MITKDFYGNNFVWWTGRVEDRVSDPLKMGLVRVRIFGLHSDDEQQVPTSSLPWAQVVNPPNSVKSFSVPRKGDWVFGFFQDGASGQMPVVVGVYSGLESSESLKQDNQENTTTPPSYSATTGTTAKSSPAGATAKSSPTGGFSLNIQIPKPPSADIIIREIEKPLNSRLTREIIDGTLINKMNNDLSKACDITALIQYDTAKVKMFFSSVMQQIRDAIRLFLKGLGFGDPSGEVRKVIQQAKEVIAEIKRVIKVFKELKEWIQLIRDVIQRIQQFIQYIRSLPQKFLQLLQQCLNSILSSIQSQVQKLVSIPGLNLSGTGVNDVLNSLSSLGVKLGASVNSITNPLGNVPTNFKNIIENPTLAVINTTTNVHLNNLIKSFPTADNIKKQTSFDTFSAKSKNLGP